MNYKEFFIRGNKSFNDHQPIIMGETDTKKYDDPKGCCWRLAPLASSVRYGTNSETLNRSFNLQLNYQDVEK